MTTCPPPADPWVIPQLGADFTRCDVANAFNSAAIIGLLAAGLLLFLLAIIAFRGVK